MRWVLPDHIEDVLPSEAQAQECLRRRLLDLFRSHGYQLVAPPLLEFADSLACGAGVDLDLRTFRLVDQLSGRMLGVRADMTPQVARIDAHLLNRKGVSRLCYCASVLHTLPSSLTATREPLQLGAELYGHAGLAADIEIVRMLAAALKAAGVAASRIDLGHVGIFGALADAACLDSAQRERLFGLLQAKDVPGLEEWLATLAGIDTPVRQALLALPSLYGDLTILDRAAALLPATTAIQAALSDLRRLADSLPDLPVSIDLADLRGYHYHSGVVFAAYGADSPTALALGGRYDAIGAAFGRARPATGFSLDLRELARRVAVPEEGAAILAPCDPAPALAAEIQNLREAGDIVIHALPGHEGTWREAGCNRQLVERGGRWVVEALEGE